MRVAALALCAALWGCGLCSGAESSSAASFNAILPVLRHPRCMNCHSAGDFPRQGDDRRVHSMGARRGPDGEGERPIRCSTCHQEKNAVGMHAPPGAPDWQMPSPALPMIWEGLSGRELCELIKDPARNGRRSIEEIVEHMSTPLVVWGWNPGEGRQAVPMPFAEFLAHVKQWAAGGAACPDN